MPYVTKDGQTQLVDDATLPSWLDQGWSVDANADAVADPTGGGIILSGTSFLCEVNNGQTFPPNLGGRTVIWDSVAEGLTQGVDPGVIVLPSGLWVASTEIDFDMPDATWSVYQSIAGIVPSPSDGPSTLHPWPDYAARSSYASITFPIADDTEVSLVLRPTVDPDAVTPTDLNISYAAMYLTKIG